MLNISLGHGKRQRPLIFAFALQLSHEHAPCEQKPKKRKANKKSEDLSPREAEIRRLKVIALTLAVAGLRSRRVLQNFVNACGVRKVWSREFKDMDEAAQVQRLWDMLRELGMTGRLSLEKAKAIRAKRELAQELGAGSSFRVFLSLSLFSRRGGAPVLMSCCFLGGPEEDVQEFEKAVVNGPAPARASRSKTARKADESGDEEADEGGKEKEKEKEKADGGDDDDKDDEEEESARPRRKKASAMHCRSRH